MTRRLRSIRRFVGPALLAAGAAALAGCGSSPPTRFFTLDAAPPAAPPTPAAAIPPVRVDAVHIPPGLDRPELVRETAANGVLSGDGAAQGASLPGAIRELTDAARSIRSLTDYLGRHPEAVLKGKVKER